jgi:hypothetical protein
VAVNPIELRAARRTATALAWTELRTPQVKATRDEQLCLRALRSMRADHASTAVKTRPVAETVRSGQRRLLPVSAADRTLHRLQELGQVRKVHWGMRRTNYWLLTDTGQQRVDALPELP